MAVKLKNGKYACGYCKKEYSDAIDAENCKDSHHLVYVAFSPEDLNKLILFIFSKDERILSPSLIERLQSYSKNSFDFNLLPKDKK